VGKEKEETHTRSTASLRTASRLPSFSAMGASPPHGSPSLPPAVLLVWWWFPLAVPDLYANKNKAAGGEPGGSLLAGECGLVFSPCTDGWMDSGG